MTVGRWISGFFQDWCKTFHGYEKFWTRIFLVLIVFALMLSVCQLWEAHCTCVTVLVDGQCEAQVCHWVHSVLSLNFRNSKKDFSVFETSPYNCVFFWKYCWYGWQYYHSLSINGKWRELHWELRFGVLGASVKLLNNT